MYFWSSWWSAAAFGVAIYFCLSLRSRLADEIGMLLHSKVFVPQGWQILTRNANLPKSSRGTLCYQPLRYIPTVVSDKYVKSLVYCISFGLMIWTLDLFDNDKKKGDSIFKSPTG